MSILRGLKILDFTTMLAGPLTTKIFADLGAEVLHIESERHVDLMRIMPPYDEQHESVVHQHINRTKKSLAINLKAEGATAIIHRLLHEYDIIVESFRPGVMKRLGLDYETLKIIQPHLIYCSITGYGQQGPYAQLAGHDNNYLAASGVLDYSRAKDKKPMPFGIQIGDVAGGTMNAAVGILAAVWHREKTGEGAYIDISITDGAFALNAVHGAQYLAAQHHPKAQEEVLNGGTYYDYYETKDRRYYAVGSLEQHFRKRLCEALDIPELIDNTINDSPYTQKRFKEAVADAFKSKTSVQWQRIFNENFDGCVELVRTFEEATEHPQLQARNMIIDIPKANGELQKQIASPIKIAGFEPVEHFAGVKIGTHTEEMLIKLGFSKDEIESMRTSQILK